jgi:hypothetical protein
MAVAIVGNIGVVAHIHVVVGVNIRPAIPPAIPVAVTVVGMAVKAVVKHVQVMVMPADRERGCDAPEKTVVKSVARRVRVVVDRV